MKKTNSQTVILEKPDRKKHSIATGTIPLIEGLNDSKKNLWENEKESPVDERKLYRGNVIPDTENSPSQNLGSPTSPKNYSGPASKPMVNNLTNPGNSMSNNANIEREESRKELIKLKHINTISERRISVEENRINDRPSSNSKVLDNNFENPDWQRSNPNKSAKNDKSKIIPGYMKNCIDDNNPDHNSVRGLFSEGEIKEAFDTLDMNKNGYITGDDLAFFLDVLEEEVQEEEIEEMIRLCDMEGNGRVKFEEFQRMASGQSLAPIGQAYPPTFQMIERKKQLETMDLKQNNTLTKPDFFKNIENENSVMSKRLDYSVDNAFLASNINRSKLPNKTEIDKATKALNSEKAKSKRECIEIFMKQHALSGKELMKHIENLKQIDVNVMLECDYISFLKYFGLNEDNEINKNAFYVLVDNEEKNINLKNFFICLIAVQEIDNKEKLSLCFNLFEGENSGFINLRELVKLVQHFQINLENNKIEKKIRMALKEKKINENMISKEKLIYLFYEFPSIFLG